MFLVQLMVLALFLSACSLPTEPDPATVPVGGHYAVIPATTEVVSPEETETEIVAVTASGEVILASGAELADRVEIGDVIVSGGGSSAPDGFLKKVVAIRQENGATVLETRQAGLTEAIQACVVVDSLTLTPAEVDSVWMADGVTLQPEKAGVSTTFGFDLDVVLFDADGDDQTDLDRITVNGNVQFTAGIDLQVVIDNWELQEFEFALRRQMDVEAELSVGAGYQWQPVKKTIATYYLSNYIIMVGIVPITFQPRIDVVLKCTVEGSVSITYGYSLVETTRNGARYRDGQWENIDEKTKEISPFAPQVEGAVEAKLSAGTRNSVKVYGLAGPYIEGMGFVKAVVEAEATPGGAELSARLEAGSTVSLGFFMEFLSHTFFDFNTEWEIYRIVFWEHSWYLGYTGNINVVALPAPLNAPWLLQGPDGSLEGHGSMDLGELPAGSYTFQWLPVADWVTPDPEFAAFNLANEDSITIAGTYVEDGPGSILGEIRDAVDYELIAGARVRYQTISGAVVAESITGSDGLFRFDEVQAGTYQVVAEADGYEANTAANLHIVDVEGDIERADFALPPLAAAQRFASFSGRVFDDSGQPLTAAGVSLSGGAQTNGVFRSTATDGDGTYAITGIVLDDDSGAPIEEFTVIVSADGFQTAQRPVLLVQNETVTNVDFNLVAWDPDAVFFSEGFEAASGWTATGFWNRSSLAGIANTAYPTFVDQAPNDTSDGLLPPPAEGQFAFWYGQASSGNFLGTQASGDPAGSGGTGTGPNAGQLTSPAFTIPAASGSAFLSYDTWFEIESVNPNASGYDIMKVSVIDLTTGHTVELGRLNPVVDPTLPDRSAIPFTSGGFNVAPVWRAAEADLSAFAGHSVQLVFSFATVDNLYNGFRGWIVDNVKVTAGATDKAGAAALLHLPGTEPVPRGR